MKKYYSTLISGLESAVSQFIKEDIQDVYINKELSGAVIYSTDKADIKLPYLNNTFSIGTIANDLDVHTLANLLIKQPNLIEKMDIIRGSRTFRIVVSVENKLTPIDRNLMQSLENMISKQYNLKTDRKRPDMEIWLLSRSEGFSMLASRLTKRLMNEKTLKKGELRPELTHTICRLSKPREDQIFLDPFSGSGAISKARSSYPYSMIFASDIEAENVKSMKKWVKQNKKSKLFSKRLDFLNDKTFDDNFIDVIAADPPWGIYEPLPIPIDKFYEKTAKTMHNILKKDGLAILLTARDIDLNCFTDKFNFIRLTGYEILLSGKKASLTVFKK